jgi:hypothetical protein
MSRLPLIALLTTGCLSSPSAIDPLAPDGGGNLGEDGSMSRDGAISNFVDAGPSFDAGPPPPWAGTSWAITWSIQGSGGPADCAESQISADTITIDNDFVLYSAACHAPMGVPYENIDNLPNNFRVAQHTPLLDCDDSSIYVDLSNTLFAYTGDTLSFDVTGFHRRVSDDVSICSITYHMTGVRQ